MPARPAPRNPFAARRARQLQSGARPQIDTITRKPCKIAREEIRAGKIKWTIPGTEKSAVEEARAQGPVLVVDSGNALFRNTGLTDEPSRRRAELILEGMGRVLVSRLLLGAVKALETPSWTVEVGRPFWTSPPATLAAYKAALAAWSRSCEHNRLPVEDRRR